MAARAVVLAVFAARGLTFPFGDAHGYVAQAHWLMEHSSLAIPEDQGARYFHGVPLLLALAGRLTGHLAIAGVGLNCVFVLTAVALFYRNFPRLDWSAWHALLLPAWLATSSTLLSEAAMWAFCLLGFTAFRLPVAHRLRPLLLFVTGYAMVCRPTAFFIILPAFVVAWADPRFRAWPRLFTEAALLGFFPLLMAAWSWIETGHVFIQSRWQADEFARWAEYLGGGFPTAVFTWPGASLLATFQSAHISASIKFLNLTHLLFFVGALLFVSRACLHDRNDLIARWLLAGLVLNGVFILTIGGPFGGKIYYRFLATQANVFVLLAWFRHALIPSWIWWLGSMLSIGLAALTIRNA